ncbi:MAG TPA: SxtJ family membrane protein [Gemmatimonadales bacterium]|nr:SxtJ family membrane protein [Gemmatimonadales bacterium]
MAHDIPAGLTAAEGRRFGLQVGVAFLVLGGVAWWRGHPLASGLLLALGGVLVVAGLAAPAGLGPVYRGWMRLAVAISRVTTPLIMGLIYFAVVTPSGLLLRLFGHRPLKRARGAASYWMSRTDAAQQRGDMHRQF